MDSFAAFFYGETVTLWSLLRAAIAFPRIEKQLLALDLLISRKAKGLLRSSLATTGIWSCPLEILDMIKDEIYAEGIDWVTAEWQADYVRELPFYFAQAPQGTALPPLPSMTTAVMTSQDWERWADIEVGLDPKECWGYFSEWSWGSQCIHAKGRLTSKDRKPEIERFLSSFGLKLLRHKPASFGHQDDTEDPFDLHRLVVPISARVVHAQHKGISFKAEYREGTASEVVDLDIEGLTRPSPSSAPFHTLCQKYRVEFVRSPVLQEMPSPASSPPHAPSPPPLPDIDNATFRLKRPVDIRKLMLDKDINPLVGSIDDEDFLVKKPVSRREVEKKEEPKLPPQADLRKKPSPRWMIWADGDVEM